MRRRQNSEINVFSTSAIDLFASGMGVFLILMVVAIPKMKFNSKNSLELDSKTVADLVVELNKLSQVNSQFLRGLTAQMAGLGEHNSKLKVLAAAGTAAMTKVEGVQHAAETMQSSQSVFKDLIQMIKVVNENKKITEKKLEKALQTIEKSKVDSQRDLSKKFIAVLLRWESIDHDVDLQVELPSGEVHSFKNKDKTVFSDSRVGPAGEIWYMEEPKVGTYVIKAYLHGKYGNVKKAPLFASIVDSKGVQLLSRREISNEGETKIISTFQVNKAGQVILPSSSLRKPAQIK